MTPAQMLRVHCTALGFLAVILKDVEQDKQALRAKTIGRLIESFCMVTVPDALGATHNNLGENSDPASVDTAIDRYKMNLLDEESAVLPSSHDELLQMYDRLLIRKIRRQQRHFYATGNEDVLANQILSLVEEEIAEEGLS
jgi:hypothetical protein